MPQRVPISENKANATPEARESCQEVAPEGKVGRRAANSTGEPEKHTVVERVGKLNSKQKPSG